MNDSTSILDAVEAQLGPDAIQKMSTTLGTDTAATSNAIAMAVPILLGALTKNVANAEGAAALDEALTQHDGGVLDNLAAFVRSAVSSGAGSSILRHILGSQRGPVEAGLGRATGLSPQQIGQLLMMLAPLLMGVLGRMKRDQSIDAQKLPEVLGRASLDMSRQSPAVGDLSRILDSNDDGQIADDVARIGSSVLGGLLGAGARSNQV
ncbi:MAG TPA: DUF937 domain-containing protein [Thermoanaerobaculia bacterium]